MYIYVCITLLSLFGTCSAATDGLSQKIFVQRLHERQVLSSPSDTFSHEGDMSLLYAEGRLTGRYGCDKYIEDTLYDTSEPHEPSPIGYIQKQADNNNQYAQFLCALYSLTGQFYVTAPDSGEALPFEVPMSRNTHPFTRMQKFASSGCAEAIFFLRAVYQKLAPSQYDEWMGRLALQEKAQKLHELVTPECKAVFEELISYLDAQADNYLSLYRAKRAS